MSTGENMSFYAHAAPAASFMLLWFDSLCGVGGATCRQQFQVNATAPVWLQITSDSFHNMLLYVFLWMSRYDGWLINQLVVFPLEKCRHGAAVSTCGQ